MRPRIAHAWPFGLTAWLLAALTLHGVAPSWPELAGREALSALPEDSPATQAERVFQRAFPGPATQSQVVLVLQRPEGLTAADKLLVTLELVPGLHALGASPPTAASAGRTPIVRLRAWSDEYVGQVLLSQDRQATLVLLDVAGDLLDEPVRRIAQATDQLLTRLRAQGKVPAGLRIELTGTAVVGRDLVAGQAESLARLRLWTPTVLVVLLALVFRRAGLVLIVLAVVVAAVQMTLDLLALLTAAGYVRVFAGLEAYVVLLLLVAGLAASGLFLRPTGQPSRRRIVLGGLAALVGCGTLASASFGRYHWAGVGMAVGQTVFLAALLTLVPSLLRFLGRRALGATRRPAQFARFLLGVRCFWAAVGARVARFPRAVVLAFAVALVPLVVLGIWHHGAVNAALLRELPPDAPSLRGIRLLKEHFPPGLVAPVVLLVVDDRVDFSRNAGVEQVRLLSQRLLQPGGGVPAADVRSVAEPLGTATAVRETIPGPRPLVALIEQVIRAGAVAYYVGASEHTPHGVARLDLLLSRDPLSPEMLARMGELRQEVARALPPELQGAQLYLLGDGPRLADFQEVVARDRVRWEVVATLAVWLVLSVGLRRPGRAACVLGAIWLGYLATLGASWLVFRTAGGPEFPGLSWQIPVLVFLILLVHGGWASLVLFQELGPTASPRRVRQAVRRSGGALAGPGLVLAGVFASLAAGATLTGIGQMAFAASLAILLQSALILPMLLPAVLGLRATSGRSTPEHTEVRREKEDGKKREETVSRAGGSGRAS